MIGKDKNYRKIYECICDCGNNIVTKEDSLKNGHRKSCGCNRIKHGMSRTKIYQVWQQMNERCYNTNSKNFMKYGDKGIKVCENWRGENGFIIFNKWATENGYKHGLTIDRIDGRGWYTPENCRWATYEQQNTNLSMLKNNKSGYRGCFYLKKYNKWLASISIHNKTMRIGTFDSLKECVESRNTYIDKNNLPHQKNIWIEKHEQAKEQTA